MFGPAKLVKFVTFSFELFSTDLYVYHKKGSSKLAQEDTKIVTIHLNLFMQLYHDLKSLAYTGEPTFASLLPLFRSRWLTTGLELINSL
jgi:hypothetical protein